MTNNDPAARIALDSLIARTTPDIACNLLCDIITDSADSDDIAIPESLSDESRDLIIALYPILTLDDDNLDAIADAFNDDSFSTHAAHIRDTLRDNSF